MLRKCSIDWFVWLTADWFMVALSKFDMVKFPVLPAVTIGKTHTARFHSGKAGEVTGANIKHVGIGNMTIGDTKLGAHAAVTKASPKGTVGVFVPKFTLSAGDLGTAEKLILGTKNVHSATTYPYTTLTELAVERTVTNMGLGMYEYTRFKKGKKSGQQSAMIELPRGLESVGPRAVSIGNTIAACVADARNLGNLRQDEGIPKVLDEWARKEVGGLPGVSIRHSIHGPNIRDAGMRLFWAVGKGAKHPPAMTILEYIGDKSSPTTTALVGKGVTFDSGGLNVKPFGSMESMHQDKMGAMATLCAFKAIAQLKLPVNVVVAAGFAENAIGSYSYHPSVILRSLKGTTVEVLNTDAEGRLVLADVLTYVQTKAKLDKKVDTIIDVATLTGAMVMALGEQRAGVFGNDADTITKLVRAGARVGEPIWPMPIGPEHAKAIEGNLSDLVNVSNRKSGGGACTAAAFLNHFVEPSKKWAHIDIAGPGMGGKASGVLPDGAPGFGVQTLVDYFRLK